MEPKLRFPEFNSNWTHDNLENVAEIFDGTHQTPLYTKTGVQFVSVENIEDIYKSEKYISHEEYDKYKNKPQINDILMTRITAGVIGETAMVTKDVPLAYYVSLALIRCEKLFPSYVEKYIHSIQFRKELYKRIIHTAFPKKINLGDIGKCLVGITNEQEQQKIAEFLSTIDIVIAKQKETVSAWEERKKGVMQKLFSQEVRFKADDGSEFPEWEEKNVEDVCSVSTGKGNTQDKVDTGAYRFYVRSPIIEHSDSYLFDEEAVITVGDGVGTGKVFHYVKGKYNLHQRCYRMYDFRDVTGKYFYYFFSTNFYRRVKSMSAKTSVDSVRMEMITKMKILVPCLAEQQKIADCLVSFDEVIEKQRATLTAWEELKKGLLQQMFV